MVDINSTALSDRYLVLVVLIVANTSNIPNNRRRMLLFSRYLIDSFVISDFSSIDSVEISLLAT
jgi:hypothetical protein